MKARTTGCKRLVIEHAEIPGLSNSEVVVTDDLHLSGGLRAATHQDGYLLLFPAPGKKTISFRSVTEKTEYHRVFKSLGLAFVGVESVSDIRGIEQRDWQLIGRKNPPTYVLWSNISHTLRERGLKEAALSARKVSFSLLTSSLRVRDISREYHQQLSDAIMSGREGGRAFSNVKCFDLYMATHSALVEMCSARDYLAQFSSAQIFGLPLQKTMAKLRGSLSRKKTLNDLEKSLIESSDHSSSDPWLYKLTGLRNLIVHQSPINNFGEHFLRLQPIKLNDSELLKVYFGIPRNPKDAVERLKDFPETAYSADHIDALDYIHWLMWKLNGLAVALASASSIPPTMMTITDKDIIGNDQSNNRN